jgi:hypothetical protein
MLSQIGDCCGQQFDGFVIDSYLWYARQIMPSHLGKPYFKTHKTQIRWQRSSVRGDQTAFADSHDNILAVRPFITTQVSRLVIWLSFAFWTSLMKVISG